MIKSTSLTACLLFAAVIAFAQITFPSGGTNRKASVSQRIGNTDVRIDYDRPIVNGREGKIWGGLVHYGFAAVRVPDCRSAHTE